MTDLTGAIWRKSTRSGDNGGACVEVASNLPGIVAVRDSKDPIGPVLTFTPKNWLALIDSIKARMPRGGASMMLDASAIPLSCCWRGKRSDMPGH